ncbi:unnamed protein product [Penicillium salamii]|uniref:Zn(2)-C6 fungal-type domain-containing protein n=1 Tax=Penicillium salamii TaxID=1612424 RepID=A0A9W4JWC6_9EURO|nr:unnamed protein product [Penicillium salamii]CAG8334182.1 unnamed protein product [Penicillium salamii]CAG8359399.1 unnamed protein product [Penicillium salamii]CAG8372306.1 unnamed protein product [Penicillium salamii]CAG8397312.1 unnamed protein product [Penicillium salamii]
MPPGGPACITCREKCRKCDRTKPVCQRCMSKGLECKGYPDKFRFAGLATRGKWKNRAVPSEARNHAGRRQPSLEANPAGSASRENTERLQNSTSLSDATVAATRPTFAHDQTICPHQIALAPGMDNPYQFYVLPLAYEQIGLLYAVLGLTACHLGIQKEDLYLRETLAVEYRVRAISRLGETLQNGLSGELSENERDGIFATIQILLLQDIFESGISTHGAHITGALSICNQLRLSDSLTREHEQTVFFLGNLAWLDIIRSLTDPRRLCFSSDLREAIVKLSDLKFERVNGIPRTLFLIMGKVMEHAKAHALGNIAKSEFESALESYKSDFYSWRFPVDGYPDDNPRWPAVAEAFRHACILHTSRLMDVTQPAEAQVIQNSVIAILDAAAEIPAQCRLIELLVMPLFMAGADALSSFARHYVLLRFDHVKNHGGLGNLMPIFLLQSVWNGRSRQTKHDNSNIYWVLFVSILILRTPLGC